ncbi:protein FAR1-RELATED SEQUENCE 5-like [Chenopodium quinoa]|uniref:protein FAR1-RELATED SEQUENCE 5-like n=1 Tax=Chenopodium quinoa TaxID=63459 RepID=UPI000B778FF5|nr:protein FAR1-RELATED SEQUENCE 5-like [Chenopodium quinoa]
MNEDGLFEVVQHVLVHNHELTRKQWHYLHRYEREMTEEKGQVIENLQKSGLSAMDSYRAMCNKAGGEENLGHTKKDHLNYWTRLKMKNIEGGDAQAVSEIMYQELANDPEFFFRFRLNKEGKLRALFWRDSMMREDYSIYGDVVVFDTTYRTNRYNLMCAPISMGGKCPISIFTDQDQAMCSAIQKVFPEVRHRLCIWHLEQKAITRFGSLKRDKDFKRTFSYCLKRCVTEVEFEAVWNSMIEKYNLQEDSWFQRIYNLKEKWCPALSKDFFSAGILSSQRSESTNHAIGFRANRSTSLTEFYSIFKACIQRWRSTEKHDEFSCSKSTAASAIPLSGLLKHASEIYTLSLFTDFEEEFGYSIATATKLLWQNGSTLFYLVAIESEPWSQQKVTFESDSNQVKCTCKNFEASGWLCYHCIRILHLHSVMRIPDQYIKKRWTKFAKSSIWERRDNEEPEQHQYTPWRQTMARKFYNLILKSQFNEEARTLIEDSYVVSLSLVEELLTTINNTTEAETNQATEVETNKDTEAETNQATEAETNQATEAETNQATSTEAPLILDPKCTTTKGRNKRPRGPLEKKRKKTTVPPLEFGAITPNLRLF